MRVGVLALQGAFIEHERMFGSLGAECVELRQSGDLNEPFDALVIPGGESTVQGKLLCELNMFEPLKALIESGLPTLGTCAGLILLARNVDGGKTHFATMDISARRNAYGRQLGSFYSVAPFDGVGKVPMTFIRAPYITEVFGDATPLATVDGKIVAARQKNQLVTAFHPELTDDVRIHEYFLNMCKKIKSR